MKMKKDDIDTCFLNADIDVFVYFQKRGFKSVEGFLVEAKC
jgi:hypothetical protein